MQDEELLKLLAGIKTIWPTFTAMNSEQGIEIWSKMLGDLDYMTCENAILELASTLKFAPAISEIREKAAQMLYPPIIDWGEAWGSVLNSIRRYGSYREAEAMESMDELTRTCVQRLGYQNLCMSENQETDRANFRMIYNQLTDRQANENRIPIAIREERNRIQAKAMALLKMEDKQDVCGEYPNQGDSSVVD